MEFDDFLRMYGIDPSKHMGSSISSNRFRQAAHRAGVKQYFRPEPDRPDEGEVDTSYSSNVKAVWYNWDDDMMYIQFDNRRGKPNSVRLYLYSDLIAHGFDARSIYAELVSSPSPGTVVWDRLRRSGAPFELL